MSYFKKCAKKKNKIKITNIFLASFLKPWRKLCCTVFTKITVVQLPVSQKTYFITADITILFVK